MRRYKIGMIPGPVTVPEEIRGAYLEDIGSSDLEPEFFELYKKDEAALREILGTENKIAIMSGEAMSILWGGLKSITRAGDKLLAVSNGLFSRGFADMGRSIGLNVETVDFAINDIPDFDKVRDAALKYMPDVITAVHCETPSGTLSPLHELGRISKEIGALLVVDFVASGVGCPVSVDVNNIDIGLLGSQKVLSLPPHLSMATVSGRAWDKIKTVKYVGYDALLPWFDGPDIKYLPYTHDWAALSALDISLRRYLAEGMENVYARHARAAKLCRDGVRRMGFELFPARDEICSPTVTAVKVPDGVTWQRLDDELRKRGAALGGNYEELAGKVFRIGHMGSQADEALVTSALEVLEDAMKAVKK